MKLQIIRKQEEFESLQHIYKSIVKNVSHQAARSFFIIKQEYMVSSDTFHFNMVLQNVYNNTKI